MTHDHQRQKRGTERNKLLVLLLKLWIKLQLPPNLLRIFQLYEKKIFPLLCVSSLGLLTMKHILKPLSSNTSERWKRHLQNLNQ